VRGRLFGQVVDEQVLPLLAMRPDLVSFAAGGNDVLRRTLDAPALTARFEAVVAGLRAGRADVLLFGFADLTRRLPGGRMILPRVHLLNRAVVETAERLGARLIDLWSDDEFSNPLMWSADRLHLSSAGFPVRSLRGALWRRLPSAALRSRRRRAAALAHARHRRVAGHVLAALGLQPDPSWLAVPARPDRVRWAAARAADARWVKRHFAPWVTRRLTGRSSGDIVVPKRPELDEFAAPSVDRLTRLTARCLRPAD
jgi:hypothetical protein